MVKKIEETENKKEQKKYILGKHVFYTEEEYLATCEDYEKLKLLKRIGRNRTEIAWNYMQQISELHLHFESAIGAKFYIQVEFFSRIYESMYPNRAINKKPEYKGFSATFSEEGTVDGQSEDEGGAAVEKNGEIEKGENAACGMGSTAKRQTEEDNAPGKNIENAIIAGEGTQTEEENGKISDIETGVAADEDQEELDRILDRISELLGGGTGRAAGGRDRRQSELTLDEDWRQDEMQETPEDGGEENAENMEKGGRNRWKGFAVWLKAKFSRKNDLGSDTVQTKPQNCDEETKAVEGGE